MYRALYRKWRPVDFDDVYGQNHVTKTLKTEVETNRISHAYLFTGSRGTGKTSCAKILSKAVNCLHPVNGNPCNECEICKGIDNGSIMDVIEIDAASNNGVENIRDIREEVNYTPAYTKYRVYIIDEVHMLSTGAFNALLKTLEEPPAHVIFILATTDIQKLPATVLSRCQRFDFKRISSEDIVSRLRYVAEKENVTITDDAANLIANISDGGMRDALSLMDRCLSISDNIDSDTVSNAAGIAGTASLFDFSEYIAAGDFTSALLLVSKLHSESCDISNICTGLTSHFRNLMVAKTVSDCEGLIICSREELNAYRSRAEEYTISKILECIDILSKTSELIRGSSNKKIQLESAVIRMCGVKNTDKGTQFYPSAEEKIKELEDKINLLMSGTVSVETSATAKEAGPEIKPEQTKEQQKKPDLSDAPVIDKTVTVRENKYEPEPEVPSFNTSQPPKPEEKPLPDGPFGLWPEIIETTMKHSMPLFAMLTNTKATIRDNKIIIITDNGSLKDFIIENERYKDLDKAIQDVTGRRIRAAVQFIGEKKETAENKSPLDDFVSKVNEFNNN